jgi:putative endonuclease
MAMAGAENERAAQCWLVYMIEVSDGSLYTGITTDMARRWRQHLAGRGAKYFRGRAPQRLVYLETGHDRGSASRREVAIKRLSVDKKRALPDSAGNALKASSPPWEFEAL